MTEISNTVDYRVGNRNDETDIWAVLEEVASEIPVKLDTPDHQDKIKPLQANEWVILDHF
jgi:hypothetical protein